MFRQWQWFFDYLPLPQRENGKRCAVVDGAVEDAYTICVCNISASEVDGMTAEARICDIIQ